MELIINALVENLLEIVSALAITAIGAAGTWLAAKIAQAKNLGNIQAATEEATLRAQETVKELQQTMVDGLKAAAADGKLTADEIESLRARVVELTLAKMSTAAINILNAAGVDLSALIIGKAEAVISDGKLMIGNFPAEETKV